MSKSSAELETLKKQLEEVSKQISPLLEEQKKIRIREIDFVNFLTHRLMTIYDGAKKIAPDAQDESLADSIKAFFKDSTKIIAKTTVAGGMGYLASILAGRPEHSGKVALGVGLPIALCALWQVNNEHEAIAKAKGFLALVEGVKGSRTDIEKFMEKIAKKLLLKFRRLIQNLPSDQKGNEELASFFVTAIARDIPDRRRQLLELQGPEEIIGIAAHLAVPSDSKDPMYSGWFTAKTLKNTQGESWYLPDLLLSSPVLVKGKSDEYFVRDDSKHNVETLKYPVQLDEKRPPRYVKATQEEMLLIKESISTDEKISLAIKKKGELSEELNILTEIKKIAGNQSHDHIMNIQNDQQDDLESSAAQEEQPLNIQGEQPMSKDDKSDKLPKIVDFQPISKTKSGLIVGLFTFLGGVGGWAAGSSAASLIASLTPIAEAAITAASVAGANIGTVYAAAQAASSGTGVAVLGSMSGVAINGGGSGAVIAAGVQSSSVMGTILLNLGITTGTMGMLVGGGVALVVVGGIAYYFYRSEQGKLKLVEDHNTAVRFGVAALKEAIEAKQQAGSAKEQSAEAKEEAKSAREESQKAMQIIQENQKTQRLELEKMEQTHKLEMKRAEEARQLEMQTMEERIMAKMEKRMDERTIADSQARALQTRSIPIPTIPKKTSSNEPTSKNPQALLPPPKIEELRKRIEAEKDGSKKNILIMELERLLTKSEQPKTLSMTSSS